MSSRKKCPHCKFQGRRYTFTQNKGRFACIRCGKDYHSGIKVIPGTVGDMFLH